MVWREGIAPNVCRFVQLDPRVEMAVRVGRQQDSWTADNTILLDEAKRDQATYRKASRSLPVSVLRASDERALRSGGGTGSDVLLTLISNKAAA
jgi:hypothetical protein